ncbi:Hsp70 family protein [Vibrio sp.]
MKRRGERTTASVIAYTDGETLVGQPAKRQAVTTLKTRHLQSSV